jgi:hypothetical protein
MSNGIAPAEQHDENMDGNDGKCGYKGLGDNQTGPNCSHEIVRIFRGFSIRLMILIGA